MVGTNPAKKVISREAKGEAIAFRGHESLNGDTPAEASGIKVEGQNMWMTIIQNAAKFAQGSDKL